MKFSNDYACKFAEFWIRKDRKSHISFPYIHETEQFSKLPFLIKHSLTTLQYEAFSKVICHECLQKFKLEFLYNLIAES
jgi:hypothetical protein